MDEEDLVCRAPDPLSEPQPQQSVMPPSNEAWDVTKNAAAGTRVGLGLQSAANATTAVEAATGTEATFAQTVTQAQNAAGAGGGATLGNALAPIALASGLMQSDAAVSDMEQHGVGLENSQNLVQGALATTSGGIGTTGLVGAGLTAVGAEGTGAALTGAAAAAAPVAMVAGAGAAGLAVGHGMAELADSDTTRTGVWGQDQDTGENRSAMDWGANWGTSYDQWAGNDGPSVMGGIAAGAGGIVGGVAGTGQAIGHGVAAGAEAVWDWL
jgi:hypothetical protein